MSLSALPLLSCAPKSADIDQAAAPSIKEQKILAKQLNGLVAGEPERCIDIELARNPVRVSDNVLLYKVSRNFVYKNTLRASCPGLNNESDIIVTKTFAGQLCRNDRIELVDRVSGIPGSVCAVGEFVPYRKP